MPPRVVPLRIVASATARTNATNKTMSSVERPCNRLTKIFPARLAVENRSRAEMVLMVSIGLVSRLRLASPGMALLRR